MKKHTRHLLVAGLFGVIMGMALVVGNLAVIITRNFFLAYALGLLIMGMGAILYYVIARAEL